MENGEKFSANRKKCVSVYISECLSRPSPCIHDNKQMLYMSRKGLKTRRKKKINFTRGICIFSTARAKKWKTFSLFSHFLFTNRTRVLFVWIYKHVDDREALHLQFSCYVTHVCNVEHRALSSMCSFSCSSFSHSHFCRIFFFNFLYSFTHSFILANKQPSRTENMQLLFSMQNIFYSSLDSKCLNVSYIQCLLEKRPHRVGKSLFACIKQKFDPYSSVEKAKHNFFLEIFIMSRQENGKNTIERQNSIFYLSVGEWLKKIQQMSNSSEGNGIKLII